MVAVADEAALREARTNRPQPSIDSSPPASAAADISNPAVALAELRERRRIADLRNPRYTEPRAKRGLRLALENCLDFADPGSWLEFGRLTTRIFSPKESSERRRETSQRDAVLTGFALVNGHRVVVVAYDYTVLAGTQGTRGHQKIDRAYQVARELNLPVCVFAEGGGGRPTDFVVTTAGLDVPSFAEAARSCRAYRPSQS